MPIIPHQKYSSPFFHWNGNLQTILPSLFRKIEPIKHFERQRLELDDGDFLDIDWMRNTNRRLVVISHGLEGSSDRHYCCGMANTFYEKGWDVLLWNFRSCSGEMNRLPRFYHSGDTTDITRIINHLLQSYDYEQIGLVGFSMGGSVTLHYLCDEGEKINKKIIGGVAISVPVHLPSCSDELEKSHKLFYNKRFIKTLKEKVHQKASLIPDDFSAKPFEEYKISRLREFDRHFTAPIHGFKDENDYYHKASSLYKLERIKRKALILNALNDPFLGNECYPYEHAENSDFIDLETPPNGGHVGFKIAGKENTYAEIRSLDYLNSLSDKLPI